MHKAIDTLARWFKPVPAVIKFFVGTDDFRVIPNPGPELPQRRRDLNG